MGGGGGGGGAEGFWVKSFGGSWVKSLGGGELKAGLYTEIFAKVGGGGVNLGYGQKRGAHQRCGSSLVSCEVLHSGGVLNTALEGFWVRSLGV